MGYNTASAEWPSVVSVPDSVRNLIDLFFNLADDTSPGVGDRLVNEVFTETGVLITPMSTIEGIEGQNLPNVLFRADGGPRYSTFARPRLGSYYTTTP
jgi:hypothetical protein